MSVNAYIILEPKFSPNISYFLYHLKFCYQDMAVLYNIHLSR